MTEETPRQPPPAGGLSAFAERYHLVRPTQGRHVAGVCAALARATRTDPVLWRVLLPVLACFGGTGLLLYLTVWLLTPEEGDTATPVEALIGRGRSSTSPVVVVLLAALGAVVARFALPEPLYVLLVAGTALLVMALVTDRSRARGAGAAGKAPTGPAAETPPATDTAAFPPTAGTAPPPPTAPAEGTGDADEGAVAAAAARGDTVTARLPDADTAGTGASADAPRPTDDGTPATAGDAAATADTVEAPGGAEPAAASGPTEPTTATSGAGAATLPGAEVTPPGGYRPPFAPHGPFAPLGSPPYGPPSYAPPPAASRPPARRERSPLPAITFFAALVLLGILGAFDLTGLADVPPTGYVAAALATVGVGLVVGTWIGRGRSLIALGLVLSLVVLPATYAMERVEAPRNFATSVSWTPTSAAELRSDYHVTVGQATLDLRHVDLPPGDTFISLWVTGGEMRVYVPEEAAVLADFDVRAGDAVVFGHRAEDGATRLSFAGSEGEGSPLLHLDLHVVFGHLEVSR